MTSTRAGPGCSSTTTAMWATCRARPWASQARSRRTGSRAIRTFIYPGPNLKLPYQDYLTPERQGRRDGDAKATTPGSPPAAGSTPPHLAGLDAFETDYVGVAERFLHTPYLWGGKTSLGIDCSGLAQTALAAAGIKAPRDSDMQERAARHAGRGHADLARPAARRPRVLEGPCGPDDGRRRTSSTPPATA